MRRLPGVAAVVALLAARVGNARAADAAVDESPVSPLSAEAQVAPPSDAPQLPQAPRPTASPPAAAPPVAAAPPDPEQPSSRQRAEDRWPIEVVHRPLTLPDGMASLGFLLAGIRPKSQVAVDPRTGQAYVFNSSVTAGFDASQSVTDRVQATFSAPRILCFAADGSSSCDGLNRWNGTGGSVRVLAFRQSGLQIAPGASIAVSRSTPVVFRWSANATFKLTLSDVAFVVFPRLARDVNPAAQQSSNPWLAYLPAEVEVQVARRVVLWGVVEPWGSVADVDRGILLEMYGGASYTFGSLGEISLEGGTYNVLSQPSWNNNVPAWFAQLYLVFWRD